MTPVFQSSSSRLAQALDLVVAGFQDQQVKTRTRNIHIFFPMLCFHLIYCSDEKSMSGGQAEGHGQREVRINWGTIIATIHQMSFVTRMMFAKC